MARLLVLILVLVGSVCFGVEPGEVLVVVNKDLAESVSVGEYYCAKRAVPKENLVQLELGELSNDISRANYVSKVAEPLRGWFAEHPDKKITCVLTTWGVPYRIGRARQGDVDDEVYKSLKELAGAKVDRLNSVYAQLAMLFDATGPGRVNNAEKLVSKLNSKFGQVEAKIKAVGGAAEARSKRRVFDKLAVEFYGPKRSVKKFGIDKSFVKVSDEELLQHQVKLQQAESDKWNLATRLQAKYFDSIEIVFGLSQSAVIANRQVDAIEGKETGAALDSELAMLRFGEYPLYRWQKNELKTRLFWFNVNTLMVARIDGPSASIAKGLVDKALRAEKNGLKGVAYFDGRGYNGRKDKGVYGVYDGRLIEAAKYFRTMGWKVKSENTEKLFGFSECPQTAFYCGWYSLRNYIPSFTFVDGAIGYHIASFEAIDLRDVSSKQWVPNLLNDGITATIGSVAEPYLSAFPYPDLFFTKILNGRQLVEAYFATKPYNSWQMMLIGDPLYKPF